MSEKEDGLFFPNCIMRYKDLSQTAKFAWAFLAQYAGKDGHCSPKMRVLAKDLGCSRENAQRAIGELVGKGFIDRESHRGKGKTNIYHFLVHECMADELGITADE